MLTQRSVQAARPRENRYEEPDGRGLFLVVQPSGSKSWAYRYRRPAGGFGKLTLGKWPTMGLADARRAAEDARRALAELRDPAKEKVARRAAVADVASNCGPWLERFGSEHLVKRSASYQRLAGRIIDKFLVPVWADCKLASISRDDVLAVIETVPAASAKVHTAAVASSFFKWTTKQRGAPVVMNPAAGVSGKQAPARDRVLTMNEVKAIWNATGEATPFSSFTRLLILTACRRNEISEMQWLEIDGDLFRLPRERSKNRIATDIPLVPLAMGILATIPRDGLYVLTTSDGAYPLNGLSAWKRRLDAQCGGRKS
jgi:integrase